MCEDDGKPHEDESRALVSRRRIVVAGVGTATALLAPFLGARPVAAHHNWNASDTRYAYYVSGTVTYVRWGNPHVEVHLWVENAPLPANWSQRALPPGAQEQDGLDTMASARRYRGQYEELDLTLTTPDWMVRWGMQREIAVGEWIEAVGFLNVDGSNEFRPLIFWLADGQGVW